MITRKSIIFNKVPSIIWIFIIFGIIHAFLFNINTAEWGDSYRILRAAETVREGYYPEDEKRPPLFSVILSLRPENMDPVVFGRFTMLFVSICSFWIFYSLTSHFITDEKYKILAMILFSLNPTFLYWSIRIMADTPFALFCIIIFYLYTVWRNRLTVLKIMLLSILAALTVLLRFEGYILWGSLGIGMMFYSTSDFCTGLLKVVNKRWKSVIIYFFGSCLVLVPYLLYRNPLNSSYFEEPVSRAYDLKMVLIYIFSLLFLFGFSQASAFFVLGKATLISFLKENLAISVFVVFELMLILLWPAAIPRLFVCIIPFLILLLTKCIKNWFDSTESTKLTEKLFIGLILIFPFVYFLVQFSLGLQFLVMGTRQIALIFLLQLPITFFLVRRNYKFFVIAVLLSGMIWSYLVINMHKNIFVSVKHAAEYSAENLTGNFGYNDLSSVSNWYLNYVGTNTQGKYYPIDSGSKLSPEFVNEKELDYLIITNEHNLDLEIDFDKREYLKVLKEFSYNVNGSNFTSYVIEVVKENL